MLYTKTRQTGFIRVNSLKKIPNIIQQPTNTIQRPTRQQVSSDSFSSFQYSNNQDKLKKVISRNIDPNYQLIKKKKNYEHQNLIKKDPLSYGYPPLPKQEKMINQSQFQNQKLKKNFMNLSTKQLLNNNRAKIIQKQKKNIQEELKNVEKICDRISKFNLPGNYSFSQKKDQFNVQLKNSKNVQCKQESISLNQLELKYQKSQKSNIQVRKTKPSQQQINSRHFVQNNNKKFQYQFSDSSFSEQRSQQSEIVYYSPRQNLKQSLYVLNQGNNYQQLPKKQIYRQFQLDQNQNQESLIQNYDKKFLQSKNLGYDNKQSGKQYYKTQGGVCFDVNTKQFIAKGKQTQKVMLNKKKPIMNKKQQILKRRQMAKIYDKQARFKLFGFS